MMMYGHYLGRSYIRTSAYSPMQLPSQHMNLLNFEEGSLFHKFGHVTSGCLTHPTPISVAYPRGRGGAQGAQAPPPRGGDIISTNQDFI